MTAGAPKRIDKGELAAREYGTGDRDLVFLHGSGLSGRLWEPVVKYFDDALGRSLLGRSLLIDLPGCGDSPAFHLGGHATFSADLDSHGAILSKFLESREVDEFDLIGHGFGAAIALAFAVRHADQVRSLSLVNPPPPAGVAPSVRTLWDLEAREPQAIETFIREEIAARDLSPEVMRVVVDDLLRADPRERSADRSTLGALHLDEMLLTSTHVSTLVVTGDRDHETAVSAAATIAETMPQAGMAVIHRAGHLLPLEVPEILAAILLDFIREDEDGVS